jgi:hypothetical protein
MANFSFDSAAGYDLIRACFRHIEGFGRGASSPEGDRSMRQPKGSSSWLRPRNLAGAPRTCRRLGLPFPYALDPCLVMDVIRGGGWCFGCFCEGTRCQAAAKQHSVTSTAQAPSMVVSPASVVGPGCFPCDAVFLSYSRPDARAAEPQPCDLLSPSWRRCRGRKGGQV